jgi:Ferritin-like domain
MGFGRAATVLLLLCAATPVVAGCGESGHGADIDPEKASDAAILDEALTQELTAAAAYGRGLSLPVGRRRALVRELRAQEREYADALTKAIRGVGGEAEAVAGVAELSEVRNRSDLLAAAYELESAALGFDIAAAPRLYTSAPRTLAAALAAGHAQHLVLLRQALGAGFAASAPEAFDGGEVPPPGGSDSAGGG